MRILAVADAVTLGVGRSVASPRPRRPRIDIQPKAAKPMNQRKQVNFTIVPDETGEAERTYANFCAIAHTPFDFTLTFCEVLPPSEKEVREAEGTRVLEAPVRARIVVPMQFVPNLISALQEHLRSFTDQVGHVGVKTGEAPPAADDGTPPVH